MKKPRKTTPGARIAGVPAPKTPQWRIEFDMTSEELGLAKRKALRIDRAIKQAVVAERDAWWRAIHAKAQALRTNLIGCREESAQEWRQCILHFETEANRFREERTKR